jgi:hypothetical protein
MRRDEEALPQPISRLLDGFFAAPLKGDRTGKLHDIRRSSLQRIEAAALARLVCELQPQNSLEIGLAEGGSCVAIVGARRHCRIGIPHIVLDPFQETLSGGTGLLELERLGLRESLTWYPERSEFYLSDLSRRGSTVNFAFVDGGHDIGQKVADAFLLNKVIHPGGIIAFHDCMLLSTSIAVRYLVTECGYNVVQLQHDGLRRVVRQGRHLLRLGPWYIRRIVPFACRSLVALKKPKQHD